MQTQTANAADTCNNKPLRLTKRIGSTTYKVSVHFSRTSKETMGDKILHLIEKDAVKQWKTPMMTPYPHSKNQVPQTRPTAQKVAAKKAAEEAERAAILQGTAYEIPAQKNTAERVASW